MDTPPYRPRQTPTTPPRAQPRVEHANAHTPPHGTDPTLERGFVASLRWLVSEGDARGVRRIAVELRALQEALATLDETRAARDDYARRAAELDKELQASLAVLGPGTAVSGNGTLVQRLAKLRERLAEDTASRRQLAIERDAWRAMCELLTQTRARVHELLEDTEQERDAAVTSVEVLKARVVELAALHDDASRDASQSRAELAALREQLRTWSTTVERALTELMKGSRALTDDKSQR